MTTLPSPLTVCCAALQVRVDLDAVQGSGVAWLEAECNGFMSPALPIVLCGDPDIVEELRTLETEVADGRCGVGWLYGTFLRYLETFRRWTVSCESSPKAAQVHPGACMSPPVRTCWVLQGTAAMLGNCETCKARYLGRSGLIY